MKRRYCVLPSRTVLCCRLTLLSPCERHCIICLVLVCTGYGHDIGAHCVLSLQTSMPDVSRTSECGHRARNTKFTDHNSSRSSPRKNRRKNTAWRLLPTAWLVPDPQLELPRGSMSIDSALSPPSPANYRFLIVLRVPELVDPPPVHIVSEFRQAEGGMVCRSKRRAVECIRPRLV